MLPLDDPLWLDMHGGYRDEPTGAETMLRALHAEPVGGDWWAAFWEALYHQGDIGEASLAVIPHLAAAYEWRRRDVDFYSYLTFVDLARGQGSNPDVPAWLGPDYAAAFAHGAQYLAQDFARFEGEGERRVLLCFAARLLGFSKTVNLIDMLESDAQAALLLDRL